MYGGPRTRIIKKCGLLWTDSRQAQNYFLYHFVTTYCIIRRQTFISRQIKMTWQATRNSFKAAKSPFRILSSFAEIFWQQQQQLHYLYSAKYIGIWSNALGFWVLVVCNLDDPCPLMIYHYLFAVFLQVSRNPKQNINRRGRILSRVIPSENIPELVMQRMFTSCTVKNGKPISIYLFFC